MRAPKWRLLLGDLGTLSSPVLPAWKALFARAKGRRKNNFPLSGSQSPGADGVVAVGLGVVMADR
jgi:hypothetical protein